MLKGGEGGLEAEATYTKVDEERDLLGKGYELRK